MCSASVSVFALDNMYCGYGHEEFPDEMFFDAKKETARILKLDWKRNVEFGNLECQRAEGSCPRDDNWPTKLLYTCTSTQVRDAGFRVELCDGGREGYYVTIYERSIAGETDLDTLPCWPQSSKN